jgi:uncharacterized protein
MATRKSAVLLAVLLTSTLVACGAESGPERRFLSIGTAPPGGAFFVVGGALADVIGRQHSADGWQVTAEATKGSQENIRRLDAGELDFAMSNAAITYFAVRGESGWGRRHRVSAVMTLAPNVALFVAPASAGIASIADLRGHRVVIGPAGAGFELFVGPILEAHGLTLDDLDVLHATQSSAVDLLGDGSAAAAFLGGAIPTASITQASASQDIVFVPFDEAAVEHLVATYPFFHRATIPAGTYRGQKDDFRGLNVGSMHLITRSDLDEETVYQVVRTIYEQRDAVIERHPAGRAIGPGAVRDVGTPFHPGAERYYREIGVWPEQSGPERSGPERGGPESGG